MGNIFQIVTLHQRGYARGHFYHLDPAPCLSTGFIYGFSMFEGLGNAEFVEVILHKFYQTVEVPGPGNRWGVPPVRIGILCGLDRGIRVCLC